MKFGSDLKLAWDSHRCSMARGRLGGVEHLLKMLSSVIRVLIVKANQNSCGSAVAKSLTRILITRIGSAVAKSLTRATSVSPYHQLTISSMMPTFTCLSGGHRTSSFHSLSCSLDWVASAFAP